MSDNNEQPKSPREADTKCEHLRVLVTYRHPHGNIDDVAVDALRATPPGSARPIMSLTNAHCADCGKAIPRRNLSARSQIGGDLHDARFRFE